MVRLKKTAKRTSYVVHWRAIDPTVRDERGNAVLKYTTNSQIFNAIDNLMAEFVFNLRKSGETVAGPFIEQLKHSDLTNAEKNILSKLELNQEDNADDT